jgi:hypothetical protein
VSQDIISPITPSVPNSDSEHIPTYASSIDDEATVPGEQPEDSLSPANIASNTPATSGLAPATSIPSVIKVPVALLSLTGHPINPIEFAQTVTTNQRDAVIKQPKLTSGLYLEAGVSNGLKGNKIGYYAGLQYSLPVSKRLSIPVGLRFRRDFHQFDELAASGTPARCLGVDTTAGSTAPDTILFEFTAENLQEIITTGFEGSIGFTYAPTQRWRIGASLSINYLQSAIARVSTQNESALGAFDQSEFLNEDANITLVSNLSSSRADAALSSPNRPISLGAGSLSSFPNFNQWVTHAGLNVSYDLTQNLSLTLAGRRLLTQPDQSKIIGLQRGQLEFGARWRLK